MSSALTLMPSGVRTSAAEIIAWTFPGRSYGRGASALFCEDCTRSVREEPQAVTEEHARDLHGDEPVYCDDCDRLLLDGHTEQ